MDWIDPDYPIIGDGNASTVIAISECSLNMESTYEPLKHSFIRLEYGFLNITDF